MPNIPSATDDMSPLWAVNRTSSVRKVNMKLGATKAGFVLPRLANASITKHPGYVGLQSQPPITNRELSNRLGKKRVQMWFDLICLFCFICLAGFSCSWWCGVHWGMIQISYDGCHLEIFCGSFGYHQHYILCGH